mgnify:CR=1 FL=1
MTRGAKGIQASGSPPPLTLVTILRDHTEVPPVLRQVRGGQGGTRVRTCDGFGE